MSDCGNDEDGSDDTCDDNNSDGDDNGGGNYGSTIMEVVRRIVVVVLIFQTPKNNFCFISNLAFIFLTCKFILMQKNLKPFYTLLKTFANIQKRSQTFTNVHKRSTFTESLTH